MASITASCVSVPSSLTGIRTSCDISRCIYPPGLMIRQASTRCAPLSVRASLKENVGKAFIAASAGVLLAMSAGSAKAFDVLMGSNGGELIFIPNEFTVAAGEPINFINNAGFPHNIVFDEDNVPQGVNASTISMSKLLNGQNEKYTVVLTTPGKYGFYCEPHQGSGMEGQLTVQ